MIPESDGQLFCKHNQNEIENEKCQTIGEVFGQSDFRNVCS